MSGKPKGWRQSLSQPQDSTPAAALTFEQRNNPAHLTGDDLRHLAHSLGMARSELSSMPDEKIRSQLTYLVARRYEDASE
jgi:hypothetical protein